MGYFDRKIIHVDMDAFFAAVEQRDDPSLRGRPVIVGGPAERRGVVSTCSYEARAFGVHSAMPTARAKMLCPQGVFISGNMEKYVAVSEEIRAVFHEYTDRVEVLSIDEAFLDVSDSLKPGRSATRLAQEIQREIFRRTFLTCSAGVSYNKFLAKVASGLKKPAGITVIPPDRAIGFLESLPVEQFYGIGRATARRLHNMNIRYGRDLKALDRNTLKSHFGKTGEFYYLIVRGIDERPVETGGERKSMGRERTFPRDVSDVGKMRIFLRHLAMKTSHLLQEERLSCRSVTIKVKYGDFTTTTRTMSFHRATDDGEEIGNIAVELLGRTDAGKRPVRLLGVSAGSLAPVGGGAEIGEYRPVQLEFDFGGPEGSRE